MTAEPASFKGDLLPVDRSRENDVSRGCKATAEWAHRAGCGPSSGVRPMDR
jgi:hypothetical protein